jgi:hypothetical protein
MREDTKMCKGWPHLGHLLDLSISTSMYLEMVQLLGVPAPGQKDAAPDGTQ